MSHDALIGTVPAIPALVALTGSNTRTPLVAGGSTRYVGLDVAATAPAHPDVVARVTEVVPYYGSVHRGAGYASRVSTELYEAARATIGRHLGARDDDVVVLTRNTTDALCLLAHALPADAEVVHLDIEHHANQLPWRTRRARTVVAAPTVVQTLVALEDALSGAPVTLLAVTGASNVTGEVPPLRALADLAHRHGARIVVDAAQLAPHRVLDLEALDLDYVALSGHKAYAPFGAGVLVGRRDWLDAAPAYLPGGGAVGEVSLTDVAWAPAPARHEGGTPNLLGAVALATAFGALAALGEPALVGHERALLRRLDDGLAEIPGLTPLRLWTDAPDRVGVASFVLDGWEPGLLAAALSAEHGIGVRDGRFCAHPLLARIAVEGHAVRASLGIGSSSDDVDALLTALRELTTHGPRWNYELTDAGWTVLDDPRDLDPLDLGAHGGTSAVPVCAPAAAVA